MSTHLNSLHKNSWKNLYNMAAIFYMAAKIHTFHITEDTHFINSIAITWQQIKNSIYAQNYMATTSLQ
jgi:hypothetical protein